MNHVASFLLAIVVLVGGVSAAEACSCTRGPTAPVNKVGPYKIDGWILDRATDIVRGRIIELHANEATKRAGRPGIVARLNVHSVIKGEATIGDISFFTRALEPECGDPRRLASGFAAKGDIVLELYKSRTVEREYEFSLCNFFALVQPSAENRD